MTATMDAPELREVRLDDGMTLGYRELGTGPPVLLVHGWPTSSLLWRGVMPAIARRNRVVALDLPGFGASDKPVGAGYGFGLFEAAIDGFLGALDVDEVSVAVHDLGGPVGLHWTIARPRRVTALALLNTLVYPEFSDAVEAFLTACATPELRDRLTSPDGLAAAMRLGVADETRLSDAAIAGVQEPFRTESDRLALAEAGVGLDRDEFAEIARGLPSLRMPVRVVYGERDAILPDIAETVARLRRDLPQAIVTALPQCGHFLQEEAPEEIGDLLADFFADPERPG